MSQLNNIYQAPQADLHAVRASDLVTPEVVFQLRSSAVWARIVSIVFFCALVVMVIGLLALVIMAFSGQKGLMIAVVSLAPWAIAFWVLTMLYGAMRDYAREARALSEGASEEQVERCFAYVRRFLKVQVILWLLFFVIAFFAIFTAVALG